MHITLHYDNARGFEHPHLAVTYPGSSVPVLVAPNGQDGFGPVFTFTATLGTFHFHFREGTAVGGVEEPPEVRRAFRPLKGVAMGDPVLDEVWCVAAKAFLYPLEPATPETQTAAEFVATLPPKPGVFLPDSGGVGRTGVGATVLAGGGVLFGLYHPNAARVFVIGSFNNWQRPGADREDPAKFCELKLYRGYFGVPNLWLGVVPEAGVGDEYKFAVYGGVPTDEKGRLLRFATDPYARELGPSFGFNNAVVTDPTGFRWTDGDWQTPDMSQLTFYEMSVWGFTEGDPGIENPGRFAGVTERLRGGYFNDLGITALSLMPLAEYSGPQGARVLGYNPSAYFAPERDFGSPDDLRALVDAAHNRGVAVLLDQVFNHTSSEVNPLWKLILEHPDEELDSGEGGLYFSGHTNWGNRIATEKLDVQSFLIDCCKLLLLEYHVDGFRLDATHSHFTDHGFLHRLADEIKAVKPRALLVAENLPNEPDLNRQGFDGYAQWTTPFHNKLKALLREGSFRGTSNGWEGMADVFFFSKQIFAAHTNNVVNYTESHDETSVPFEVGSNPALDHPAARDRKGRLGLFATTVALGQPMIYMGQEFNVERDHEMVSFAFPDPPGSSGFYQWASRLLRLRRRYPALKLSGYNPADAGQFAWILGPFLDGRHGGGKRVLGWRLRPNPAPHEAMIVLLNFENHDVTVDLELGLPGVWVKLADVDRVNDVPPEGFNSPADPGVLHSNDGRFAGFVLPSSSAFLYKLEAF